MILNAKTSEAKYEKIKGDFLCNLPKMIQNVETRTSKLSSDRNRMHPLMHKFPSACSFLLCCADCEGE